MSNAHYNKVVYAANANLNQAENTVLLTFIAIRPVNLIRFGANANSANGILAATRLKLRETPLSTGTAADISGSTLNPGALIARGNGVYKDLESRVEIDAGDTVTIAVSTDAGGASTADVWLEYQEEPFAGSRIDNMSESA